MHHILISKVISFPHPSVSFLSHMYRASARPFSPENFIHALREQVNCIICDLRGRRKHLNRGRVAYYLSSVVFVSHVILVPLVILHETKQQPEARPTCAEHLLLMSLPLTPPREERTDFSGPPVPTGTFR